MSLSSPVTTACCGATIESTTLDGTTWYECAACGRVLPL